MIWKFAGVLVLFALVELGCTQGRVHAQATVRPPATLGSALAPPPERTSPSASDTGCRPNRCQALPAPGTFLVPVAPRLSGSHANTLPPLELPSLGPPIGVLAVGGATVLSGGAVLFVLLFKALLSEPDYDDDGNEVQSHHKISPAGIASIALLGTGGLTLTGGFIWLHNRRDERLRIKYRHKQELQYRQDKGMTVSFGPQGAGARLRISF